MRAMRGMQTWRKRIDFKLLSSIDKPTGLRPAAGVSFLHAIERDQIDIITDTSLFFSLSCPFYICHTRERKNQEKGKKKKKIKGLTDKSIPEI